MLNDVWALVPHGTASFQYSSTSALLLDSAHEGRSHYASAERVQDAGGPASDAGMCVLDVTAVELTLTHPCPRELEIWLYGPGVDARNRDGDLGALVLNGRSMQLSMCPGEATEHTIILDDDASDSFWNYSFSSGTFRPESPLRRYRGLPLDESAGNWKIRVVDKERNDSPHGTVSKWSIALTAVPCEPETTWVRLDTGDADTVRPPARYDHSVAIVERQLLVFGGIGAGGALDDLWSFDLDGDAGWTVLEQVTVPDLRSSVMVPFAGFVRLGYALDASLYAFVEQKWVPLALEEPRPAARSGASVVYDPARESLVLFGGKGSAGPMRDMWRLALVNVSEVAVRASQPAAAACAGCVAAFNASCTCGPLGEGGSTLVSRLWASWCRALELL